MKKCQVFKRKKNKTISIFNSTEETSSTIINLEVGKEERSRNPNSI